MFGYWAASQVEAKRSAPTDIRNPDRSHQPKHVIFLNCKSENVKTEELKTVEMCAGILCDYACFLRPNVYRLYF